MLYYTIQNIILSWKSMNTLFFNFPHFHLNLKVHLGLLQFRFETFKREIFSEVQRMTF